MPSRRGTFEAVMCSVCAGDLRKPVDASRGSLRLGYSDIMN
jgi:hypothetical protein